jgi:hypothetical protein
MGRGRAKAKQTRVARELKYHSPNTDLAALQRELARGSHKSVDDDAEQYGEFVDGADDEEDEEDDPASGSNGSDRTGRSR